MTRSRWSLTRSPETAAGPRVTRLHHRCGLFARARAINTERITDELEHGLEGVLVDESELSDIDGDAGRLLYRGYPVGELASEASFEEVLWLLWHGELPDRAGLDTVADTMGAAREVDDRIIDTLGGLAADDERPMAALRTGVSMLPATDPTPDAEPEDTDATLAKGRRITAKRPTILAAYDRLRSGSAPVAPRPDLGHAANFLYMLTGEAPDEVAAETFDTALTLRADHGLNASTFTAMTVASTYADIHSAVTAAVGALSGPLHGGANRAVIETLRELDDSGQDPRVDQAGPRRRPTDPRVGPPRVQ